jgi:hypothetical protein
MTLTSRSTVREFEQWCRDNGIRLKGFHPDTYATDSHFEIYAYGDILTLDDAYQLLDAMEAECPRCSKVRSARCFLAMPFWVRNIERIRSTLASSRRVCCSKHESGSFALRKNPLDK